MTGAWWGCVQLGDRVMAGAIVMLLSGGNRKVQHFKGVSFSPQSGGLLGTELC